MASVNCYQGRWPADCPTCGKSILLANHPRAVITGGAQHLTCFTGGLTRKKYRAMLRGEVN